MDMNAMFEDAMCAEALRDEFRAQDEAEYVAWLASMAIADDLAYCDKCNKQIDLLLAEAR